MRISDLSSDVLFRSQTRTSMEVFVLFHILWSLPRGGTTHGGSRRSMLTKKQHELLLFIHRHLQKNGVSPSFDEMKDALALKSKSGIPRLITGDRKSVVSGNSVVVRVNPGGRPIIKTK